MENLLYTFYRVAGYIPEQAILMVKEQIERR